MHSLLEDGTVLFADAFGLTRIDPSDRPKTLPQPLGKPDTAFVVDLARGRLWTQWSYTYQRKFLDLTTLKPVSGVEAPYSPPLPSGRQLVGSAGAISVLDPDRGEPSLLHDAASWAGAPDRGEVALSEDEPVEGPGGVAKIARLQSDARWTLLPRYESSAAGTSLQLGLFDRDEADLQRWRVTIAPRGALILQGFLFEEGITLVGWDPRRSLATAQILSYEGEPRARFTLPALELLASDGARLIHQPDARTVAAASLDGSETQRWSIPEVAAAAREKAKKKALAFKSEGPGAVIAGRGRVLFLPWHAESVLDLDRAVEIPRKLKAAELKGRKAFTTWLRDHREERFEVGLWGPYNFSINAKRGTVGTTFWSPLLTALDKDRKSQGVIRSSVEAVAVATKLKVSGYGSEG